MNHHVVDSGPKGSNPRGRVRPRMVAASRLSPAAQVILAIPVFIGFALETYFVSPGFLGIPFRLAYIIVFLLALIVTNPHQFRIAIRRNRPALAIFAYLGVVGLGLSALAGSLLPALLELVEVHIQAVIVLLFATTATLVIGQRSMTYAFAGTILISCLVSVLQRFGVPGSLAIRGYLGTIKTEYVYDIVSDLARNPGLSYSPIFLAQQTCLMFALGIFGAMNRYGAPIRRGPMAALAQLQRWHAILGWTLVVFAIAIIGGNRSPVLGLAIFFALVLSANRPKRLILAIPIIVLIYFVADPIRETLAEEGYRVAQSTDKSVLARWPLLQYGWRLFLHQPWGYGLAFESRKLASVVSVADIVVYLQDQLLGGLLWDRDLHNTWLISLNIYGLFILPVAYYGVKIAIKYWPTVIGFVPYLVHVTFHNSGPLTGDYLFWIPVGIVVGSNYLPGRRRARNGPTARQRRSANGPRAQDSGGSAAKVTLPNAQSPKTAFTP